MVVVRMPDKQLVRFPDDMPDEQIRQLIGSKYDMEGLVGGTIKGAKNTIPALVGSLGATQESIGADVQTGFSKDPSSLLAFPKQILPDSVANMMGPVGPLAKGADFLARGAQYAEQVAVAGTGALTRAINPSAAENVSNFGEGVKTSGAKVADDARKAMLPTYAPMFSPGGLSSAGATSLGAMVPMIAIAAITKNPTAALAPLAIQSYGQGYDQGKQAGLSDVDSKQYGLMYAAADVLPETGVIGEMLKPGKKLLARIGSNAVNEAASEVITQAVQTALDKKYITPDMTWGEAWPQILQAGILGFIPGAFFGATVHPHVADGHAPPPAVPPAAPAVPPAPTGTSLVPVPGTLKSMPTSGAVENLPALPHPDQFAPADVPRRHPPAPGETAPTADLTDAEHGALAKQALQNTRQQETAALLRTARETISPVGTFSDAQMNDVQGGGAVLQAIKVMRSRVGRPMDTPVTMEDLSWVNAPQDVSTQLLAKRKSATTSQNATAQDVRDVAKSKNILLDKAFSKLAERTTGSSNLDQMNATQLNVLHDHISSLDAHETKISIPIAPQTNFSEEQYGKAVDAVQNTHGRYTDAIVKEASGLKQKNDIIALRDAMLRRGVIAETNTGYRPTTQTGMERQPVLGDLAPAPYTVHTVREMPVESVDLLRDGKVYGTYQSASDLDSAVSKIRAKEADTGKQSTLTKRGKRKAFAVVQQRANADGTIAPGEAVVSSHPNRADADKAAASLNDTVRQPPPGTSTLAPDEKIPDGTKFIVRVDDRLVQQRFDTAQQLRDFKRALLEQHRQRGLPPPVIQMTQAPGTTEAVPKLATMKPVNPERVAPAAMRGRLAEIVARLKALGDTRGLELLGVTTHLKNEVKAGDGTLLSGKYSNLEKVIEIAVARLQDPAMSIDDVVDYLAGVQDHELIHALYDAGVLGPETQGWKTLSKYIGRAIEPGTGRTYLENARANYAGVPPEVQVEEAIAQAFRFWAAKRRGGPVVGKPATVFEQLAKWFQRLFKSMPDDIFSKVESGQLVRDLKAPGSEMPRATATTAVHDAAKNIQQAQAASAAATTPSAKAMAEHQIKISTAEFIRAREQARNDARGRASPKTINGTTATNGYNLSEPFTTLEAKELAAKVDDKPSIRSYVREDPAYMQQVAAAYEAAPHAPKNDAVVKAYRSLAKETLDLFNKLGVKVVAFTGSGEPYSSKAELLADVKNGVVRMRLTADMYGKNPNNADHPMLAPSGKTAEGSTTPLTYNDLMRVVTSLLGYERHGLTDNPTDSYNVYHQMKQHYGVSAQRALATEMLAHNAWQNYGKHMQRSDGSIPIEGVDDDILAHTLREFPLQKAVLLPEALLVRDPGIEAIKQTVEDPEEIPDGERYSTYEQGDILRPTPGKIRELSSVPILYDGKVPKAPTNSKSVQEVARILVNRGSAALKAMGVESGVADQANPRDRALLVDAVALEIESAFNASNHAGNWYTTSVEQAMAVVGLLHPETLAQPEHRIAFKLALAITSQGETVTKNSDYTEQVYRHFRQTGRFPTNLKVNKTAFINGNFGKLNSLLDHYESLRSNSPMQDIEGFLAAEYTVRDLKAAGWTVSGENMETRVYGSAILGPKIGQGFYQNLTGNYLPVTMDLWFMRAWGRLTGTLVGQMKPAAMAKTQGRFVDALLAERNNGPFDDTQELIDQAYEIHAAHERNYAAFSKGKKALAENKISSDEFHALTNVTEGGAYDKSELVKSAEAFLKAVYGVNESPKSGNHRQWMRDTIEGARLQLAAKGIHLTPADMQALWWYPEKDLYEHMGGEPAESNRVSYIDAFRAAALARGITNEEIERAILSSAGRGSGRNSGNDPGADPQGRGGDRPVIPASKREAIGTVGAAPTARSALSGERFSLASKDFQRYFGDRLPGGRLYGREDLALGGILRNPGTPSVALSSPVDGSSYFGGPLSAAHAQMASDATDGATMVYMRPADFIALSDAADPTTERNAALAGFTDTGDVLDHIAANSTSVGFRALAARIAPYVKGVPYTVVNRSNFAASPEVVRNLFGVGNSMGAYRPDAHDVHINDMPNSRGLSEMFVLHEALHAATEARLQLAMKRENPTEEDMHILRELRQIMTAIRKSPVPQNISTSARIMESDAFEILTYGLTDPDVRNFLQTIKMPSQGSAWSRFKALLYTAFGIRRGGSNALSRVIDLSDIVLAVHPQQAAINQAIEKGHKFSSLPSLVFDGKEGAVEVSAMDGVHAARALDGKADHIPVMVFPADKGPFNFVSGFRKGNEVIPVPGNTLQQFFPERRGARHSLGSEAFRAWWKDSKVVDKNGVPLVVYHASENEFTAFDKNKSKVGYHGKGFYFTPDKEWASSFGKNMKSVYISLQKPFNKDTMSITPAMLDEYVLVMKERGATDSWIEAKVENTQNSGDFDIGLGALGQVTPAEIQRVYKANGFDGVIAEDGNVVVAFEPEQIKSAIGNRGTWSTANADIRYSLNSPLGTRVPPVEPDERSLNEIAEPIVRDYLNGTRYSFFGKAPTTPPPVISTAHRVDTKIIGTWMETVARSDLMRNVQRLLTETETSLKYFERDIQKLAGTVLGDDKSPYAFLQRMSGLAAYNVQQAEKAIYAPLRAALAARKKIFTLKEFDDFLFALHVPEANRYLRALGSTIPHPSGQSDAWAADTINRLTASGKITAMREVLPHIAALRNAITNENVSSGYLAPGAVSSVYQNWIVRKDGIDAEEREGVSYGGWRSPGRGMNIGREPRVVGRESAPGDIVANMIMKHFASVARSGRLEFGRKLEDLVRMFPAQAKNAIEVINSKDPRLLKQMVVDGKIVTRPDPNWRQRPDIFITRRDGKDVVMMVKDKRMQQFLSGADVYRLPPLYHATVGKFSNFFKNTATTWSPIFIIVTNPPRDLIAASLRIGSYMTGADTSWLRTQVLAGYLPAVQTMRAYHKNGGKPVAGDVNSQYYHEFLTSGVTKVHMGARTLEDISADLVKAMKTSSASSAPGEVLGTLKKIAHFMETLAGVMDNGTRLSAFTALRSRGHSVESAAYVAGNITVNYSKKGALTGLINPNWWFFNAGMQDTANVLASAKTKSGQRAIVASAVAGVGVELINQAFSALLKGAGDDDRNKDGIPDYEQMTEFEMEQNLVVPNPVRAVELWMGIKTSSQPNYIKFPLPLGYAGIYNIGRNIANMPLRIAHPEHGKTILDSMMSMPSGIINSVNPIAYGSNWVNFLMPSIGDPWIDMWNNTSYAGTPIHPDQTQYGDNTTPNSATSFTNTGPVPKWIAENLNAWTFGDAQRKGMLDFYPDNIEYFWKNVTAGVGTFVDQLWYTGTNASQIGTPNFDPGKTPLFGRSFPSNPSRTAQTDYYSIRDLATTAENELDAAKKLHDVARQQEIRARYETDLSLVPVFKGSDKKLSALRKDAQKARDNRLLTPDARAEKLRKIKLDEDALIAKTVATYVKRAGG